MGAAATSLGALPHPAFLNDLPGITRAYRLLADGRRLRMDRFARELERLHIDPEGWVARTPNLVVDAHGEIQSVFGLTLEDTEFPLVRPGCTVYAVNAVHLLLAPIISARRFWTVLQPPSWYAHWFVPEGLGYFAAWQPSPKTVVLRDLPTHVTQAWSVWFSFDPRDEHEVLLHREREGSSWIVPQVLSRCLQPSMLTNHVAPASCCVAIGAVAAIAREMRPSWRLSGLL